MAMRDDFTLAEWTQIKTAPLSAALYVLLASPSGLVGTIKEGLVVIQAVAALTQDAGAHPILKELFAALPSEGGDPMEAAQMELISNHPDQQGRMLPALEAAIVLIDAKMGAGAPVIKQWIHDVSERVAKATKEGGFLGLGGTLVSREERAALDELKRILGL